MTGTGEDFGSRLSAALDSRGSLCVGIDPHAHLLQAWGLPDDAAGLAEFAERCVEGFAKTATMVKPQSAFFERFGSKGIQVLEQTVTACRQAGALVLLDVKRGDIGSTMRAYADAYLRPGASLEADAVTLSPYLGVGSLEPAFELCDEHGHGAFVLAATSNPEGPQIQHARNADGVPVAQSVLAEIIARNRTSGPLGSFGVVAGATIEAGVVDFAGFNGPILAPGLGAQGGTAADVRRVFGSALGNVIPSVSREVLRQGPDAAVLRAAAERLVVEFGFLRS